jgi:hypothetical protein
MNLDPTQIMLLALLVSMGADKLFVGYLISLLARSSRAQPVSPPVAIPPAGPVPVSPGPVAVQPPVGPAPAAPPSVIPPVVVLPTPPLPPPVVVPPAPIPSPAAGLPRFTNITTSSFAGGGDSEVSKESAYYPEHYPNKYIESDNPGAALPYHFPGTPPVIRVFFRGKTVDCPIVDVGPWNTHDPYWDHGARPKAESGTDTTGRHTNLAGLDITPGAWKALGKTGNLDAIKDITSWDFVSVLDKGNPAPAVPVSQPSAPAPVAGGTVLQHNTWPPQSQAASFFGAPGTGLVKVTCPWLLTVEGTHTQTITIHTKCAASLTRILNYIWEQCGKNQAQVAAFGYDIFDGSFNDRDIAGTGTLSQHAYGAALDFNAAANPQHAPLSKTKFKEDSLIVQAFKGEGWTWGGDWSPAYIDAMHFQALKA